MRSKKGPYVSSGLSAHSGQTLEIYFGATESHTKAEAGCIQGPLTPKITPKVTALIHVMGLKNSLVVVGGVRIHLAVESFIQSECG